MIEGATQEVETPPSLHDVVEAAYDEVEVSADKGQDRPRDESGRFAPSEKKEAKQEKVERPEAAPVSAPAYTPPKRPASWKADLDPHWAKLPKEVHDEIARRESDFVKGVSTYKTEYDRLRPLGEALKPYEPMMQQAGITPDKFIHALASTHQTLTQGSKEQKLAAFARFAQEYQIPLHEMLIQGEDGKVYFNQQYFQQPAQQQQQPGLTREDVQREAQQVWMATERARQMRDFLEAKDDKGNPKHPHFETLSKSMDGLLRAGLAKDLPTAYQAALRLPEHAPLYDEMHKQHSATQEAAKAQAQAAAAQKAKANVVSPRPRTPTGTAGNGGAKSLREAIETSVEEVSGR